MDKKHALARVRDRSVGEEPAEKPAKMVRTQVYLTVEHRRFLAREAKLHGVSMAMLLRDWIGERMKPKNDRWDDNPLLEATPEDGSFEGHEDGSENSDRHIYGLV